jgi:hypothetical protein
MRKRRAEACASSAVDGKVESPRGAVREDGQVRVSRHFAIFDECHLRHLLREFVAHYNAERFRQGLDGQLVRPR